MNQAESNERLKHDTDQYLLGYQQAQLDALRQLFDQPYTYFSMDNLNTARAILGLVPPPAPPPDTAPTTTEPWRPLDHDDYLSVAKPGDSA
jgi:hypothetical protein